MVNQNIVDENLTVESPGAAPAPVQEQQENVAFSGAFASLAHGLAGTVEQPVEDDPNGITGYIRKKYNSYGELPNNVKRVIVNLNTYIRDMGPNTPQTKESIAVNQRTLWNTIKLALGSSPADSVICIDSILYAFSTNYTTVFNERLLWRGIRDIKLSQSDMRSFKYVGTLFVNTAVAMLDTRNTKKPTIRAAQQTSLREVVSSLTTPEAQMNLTSYYSSN